MFYNTIHLKGADLDSARSECKSQEEFIKLLFKIEPTLEITPSQLLSLFNNNTPITSVRRALTNLTNDNVLEKTEKQIVGMYGKLEHVWKLNTQTTKSKVVNNYW